MKILKHIYLDKTFIFFLLIVILTGSFNSFIAYFSLLLIHEMGHALMGVIYGYKLDRIALYPYGGITTFNLPLNISLKEELMILIMGPIMQIIGYFLLKNFFIDINIYHNTLLFFNLLPIYPLDGGKIMNILFGYHFNYLRCFNLTFFVSFFVLLGIISYFIVNVNLNGLMTLLIVFLKLIDYYRKKNYYYQRFLLERYLYNYRFRKLKYIKNELSFYRDKYHYINNVSEKEYLNIKYKNKKM